MNNRSMSCTKDSSAVACQGSRLDRAGDLDDAARGFLRDELLRISRCGCLIFFVLPTHHDPQRVLRQRLLERLRLVLRLANSLPVASGRFGLSGRAMMKHDKREPVSPPCTRCGDRPVFTASMV